MANTVSKRGENEILEKRIEWQRANSLRTKGFQVVGESDVRLSFAFSRGGGGGKKVKFAVSSMDGEKKEASGTAGERSEHGRNTPSPP